MSNISRSNPSRARRLAPRTPSRSLPPVPPSAEASDLIRSIDAAPAPAPRIRHVGETEDGHRVMTRTARPIHQVRATLKRKAIEDAIMTMSDDELASVQVEPEPVFEPSPSARHVMAISDVRKKTPRPAVPVDLTPRPTVDEITRSKRGLPANPTWQHPALMQQGVSHTGTFVIQSDVTLTDRYPVYVDYLRQKHTSRSCTIGGLWTLRILTELVGDKRLCELGPGDVDVFLHAISVWPPHASKRRDYRLMKAPAVVAKAKRLKDPPIDVGTQQRHIDLLRTFFRWLENRHEVVPGLLKGVRLFSSTDDRGQRRKPFDPHELELLFHPKHDKTFTKPHQYWARFLGYYQGLRVNELSQIYVDDISLIDGLWCIDVTRDRPGQRLKNSQSRRTLPIHPVLVENGFLDFVQQARRWGRVTLFPGLVWGANGPGDTTSDWFNRSFLRRTCGIKAKDKVFHSFRHNFATHGERSGLSDARIAIMLGHSAGDSILRKHYLMKLNLLDMQQSMGKMQFMPLQHLPYEPAQYEQAFEQAAEDEARFERIEQVYGRAA
ncbi:tyrosine-type recombinase/integrase [Luteibacter aegosomaticola]|uniref:site-specific integrase n=1 Tax=Luteibacter aegosomaticola TaxID=2911538 RepID=UPI001FFB9F01|nr:site-specific integrase [Luteibacter aegosomaticola]UPG88315.1 tyrosine-type recombinase/integrase [Luteibacter aegosomaticola]